MRYIIRIIFFLLAFQTELSAQNFLFDNDIIIIKGSDTLKNAWAGGFNNPQWSQADFNGDGLADLFVFDRSDASVSIFIAQNLQGKINYLFSPNLAFKLLPKLYYWALLRDVNCDGVEDVVTSDVQQNLIYYLGKRKNDELSFSNAPISLKYKFLEYENGPMISNPNLYIPASDISGFADMDFDGDLDILVNNTDGTSVLFFRNYAVERFARCDTFDLELVSLCWGHFAEIYDGNNFDVDLNKAPCQAEYKTSHVGGTLTPINLNGDTLMDCIISDAGLNNMIALFNGGNRKIAHIIDRDAKFPTSSEAVDISYFPAAYILDVNGDGKQDLIASPNDAITGEDVACAWYYENISDSDTPNFLLQSKDFLVREMPDLGRGVTPVWWDYNKDGLPDLILAGRSKFITFNQSKANLTVYKNVGTKNHPVLSWVTDSLLDFSGAGIDQLFLTPAFADLDGDGDDDLLLGGLSKGWVSYWENTASANDSLPVFKFRIQNYLNLPDVRLIESAPCFYDWDKDGDLDLVVGTGIGEIFFYRNTGSSNAPSFRLETEKLGYIKVTDEFSPYLGKAYPFFMDGNNDGLDELWVSNASGKIYIYHLCPNPLDSFPLAQILFQEKPLSKNLKVSIFPQTDSNHHITLTIGTERGGILSAKSHVLSFQADSSGCSLIKPPPKDTTKQFSTFKIFPNPASDLVTVSIPETGVLVVYNLLGQKVASFALFTPQTSLKLGEMVNGIYILNFTSENYRKSDYLMIVR